jgi:hypothetical protein
MPKILSSSQVEQYKRDGFAFPVPALDAKEVRALRVDLEYWERQQGRPLDYPEKSKPYLLYRWADVLVHHPKVLVHCSPGNDNDDRRMGLGISFIPAHVRPLGSVKPSALLVRGQDRYGHFLPEQRLESAMSPQAQAAHAEAVRLFRLRQNQGFSQAAE